MNIKNKKNRLIEKRALKMCNKSQKKEVLKRTKVQLIEAIKNND
jgi:hypothetical protein